MVILYEEDLVTLFTSTARLCSEKTASYGIVTALLAHCVEIQSMYAAAGSSSFNKPWN